MADVYDSAKDTLGPDVGGISGSAPGGGGLGLGTLALGGAGALGIGAMLMGGPAQLPQQYRTAEAMVPGMQAKAGQLYGEGQGFVTDAQKGYDMARRGELTPEQAANLKQFTTGLENQARQTYASMGRDFGKDTSAISTQETIDTATIAAAQNYIQSTIALATQEMSAGSSLIGQSIQEESAATQILLQAGQAQIALDKQYSDSIAAMFGAIGKVVGVVGGAMVGGPAGAAAGGALASALTGTK